MTLFWIVDLKEEILAYYFSKTIAIIGIVLYLVELVIYVAIVGIFTSVDLDLMFHLFLVYLIFIFLATSILLFQLCKQNRNNHYKKHSISPDDQFSLRKIQKQTSTHGEITLKNIGLILLISHNAIFSFVLVLYNFKIEFNTDIHIILIGISGFGIPPSLTIFFLIEMNLILNLVLDFHFREEFFRVTYGLSIIYKIQIFKGFIFIILGGGGAVIGIVAGIFTLDVISIIIFSLLLGICFFYMAYDLYKKIRKKYKTKEGSMIW